MTESVAQMRRLLNKEGLRPAIKRLSYIWQYETYGPLIGPKVPEQPRAERRTSAD